MTDARPGVRGWLRLVGQFCGLIYRDDGRLRVGPERIYRKPPTS